MPAPLRIILTQEETITLQDLRVAPKVAQRTRDRAQVLLANANGCNTPAIAQFMGCREHTVREAIRRWRVFGLRGLWDAERNGSKPRWTEEDMEHLEKCLEEEERTYNSHQLAQKLAKERHVHLSAHQIRKVLKKRAGDGKERDIAKNGNKTSSKKS